MMVPSQPLTHVKLPEREAPSRTTFLMSLFQKLCRFLVVTSLWSLMIVVLYCLIAAPPLQFIYDKAPSAGPNSVYVPGAGFAGFWYHLGLFHGIFTASSADKCTGEGCSNAFSIDSEYYCYSSGCLSLLLAIMNLRRESADYGGASAHLDFVYDAAFDTQKSLRNGEIRHFDIVESFMQKALLDPIESGEADEKHLLEFLPNFNILITSGTEGVQIKRAENLADLVSLMIQTTWIPYVTGDGFGKVMEWPADVNASSFALENSIAIMQPVQKDWFLDGGFSRWLHPVCEHVVSVPINWKTTIHSLNPGMSREATMDLYQMGMDDSRLISNSDYGLFNSGEYYDESDTASPSSFGNWIFQNFISVD